MYRLLLQALKWGGPAALGYVSNDLITWMGSWPLVGSFFSKKNSDGSTPWYVPVVGLIGFSALLIFILKKVFKIKIF